MRDSLRTLEARIAILIKAWEKEYPEATITEVNLERIDVTGHGRTPDSLLRVMCRAEIKP